MAGCTGLCLHYSVLMVAVSTRLAPTGPPFGFQIPVSLGSPGRSNGTYLNVGSDETPELRAPSSCGRDSEACVGVCECHIGRDRMWTPVTLQCTSKAASRAFRPPPASCSLGGCLAISWRDVLGVQEKKRGTGLLPGNPLLLSGQDSHPKTPSSEVPFGGDEI